jgi:hypothetical protein
MKNIHLLFLFLAGLTFLRSHVVLGNSSAQNCTFDFYVGEGSYIQKKFEKLKGKGQSATSCDVACGVGCYVGGEAGYNMVNLGKVVDYINTFVGNWNWEPTEGLLYKEVTDKVYGDIWVVDRPLTHSEMISEINKYFNETYSNFNMKKNPSFTREKFLEAYLIELQKKGFDLKNISLGQYKDETVRINMAEKLNEVNLKVRRLQSIGWMNLVQEKWVEFLFSSYMKMNQKKCQTSSLNFHCLWNEGVDTYNQKILEERMSDVMEGVQFGDHFYHFKLNHALVPNNPGFKNFLKNNNLSIYPRDFSCKKSVKLKMSTFRSN